MENDYKVKLLCGEWRVTTEEVDEYFCLETKTHYKGNLSDCYAWIKLTNGGFM